MANVPVLNIGGTDYNIKDAEARNQITDLKSALNNTIMKISNISAEFYKGSVPQRGWVGQFKSPLPLFKGMTVRVEPSSNMSFILSFMKNGDSTYYQQTEYYGSGGYPTVTLSANYDKIAIYSDNSATVPSEVSFTVIVNYIDDSITAEYDISYFSGLSANGIYPYNQVNNYDMFENDVIGICILSNNSKKFNRYILFYSTSPTPGTSDFDQSTVQYFYNSFKEFVVPSNYKALRLVAETTETETITDFSYILYKKEPTAENIILRSNIPTPKTFAVLGDSWSSYKKFSTPPSNRGFYPPWETDVDGRTSGSDVTTASQMWWSLLQRFSNISLVANNSYSGSPICFDGTGSGTQDAKSYAYATRVMDLPQADVFFIMGGTNDASAGATIGEAKYSQWSDEDLSQFKPALCFIFNYLLCKFPLSKIYFMIPSDLNDTYKNAIIDVCDYYNVPHVIIWGMQYLGYHPNAASQEKIARYASRMLNGFHD